MEVGFYSIAIRLITLPLFTIGTSIGEVYRQRISEEYYKTGKFDKTFLKTLYNTFFFALISHVAMYYFFPDILVILLGNDWAVSGEISRILIISSFFQLVFTPVDKGALVAGKTKYIFIWHSLRVSALAVLYMYSLQYDFDFTMVLWSFVIINAFFYILDGLVEYYISRGSNNDY